MAREPVAFGCCALEVFWCRDHAELQHSTLRYRETSEKPCRGRLTDVVRERRGSRGPRISFPFEFGTAYGPFDGRTDRWKRRTDTKWGARTPGRFARTEVARSRTHGAFSRTRMGRPSARAGLAFVREQGSRVRGGRGADSTRGR